MVSESTTSQKDIDILRLKKLREEARNKEALEGRTRHNNFIESERARVRALIPTIPQRLEEAAREGRSSYELSFSHDGVIEIREDKLMEHPAYGELIRYLESQGLTNLYITDTDFGTDYLLRINIKLP